MPDLILQVGGSISFAPEDQGAEARWLSDDTRHLLAETQPPPDQVTIASGLHVRCGIEDNLWSQRRDRKFTTVEQIEQLVRISREFGRDIADAQEARAIYRIGTFYRDAEETLAMNGFTPTPRIRQPLG